MDWKKAKQPQPPAAADRRLMVLAQELGVAGVQVLVAEFGFTAEQAHRWLELMLERAQKNRNPG
jgi:hypothetical protein